MWSKLKQKIVQAIDIIKKYGAIFSLCKFILLIIKSLFKKLIFDIKQYRNDYRKVEARKQYLKYFLEKWGKTANENDKMFYKLLEEDYKITCKKIKINKRKNFNMNFFCLFLPVIIFTVGFIVVFILGNQISIHTSKVIYKLNWKFNLYIIVYYIILMILTRIFSRWINVKKYHETWIRHSGHRYELDEEIFKFIEKMECYEESNREERKKLFKRNILNLWNKDQKEFEKNMRNEEKMTDLSKNIKEGIGNVVIKQMDKI